MSHIAYIKYWTQSSNQPKNRTSSHQLEASFAQIETSNSQSLAATSSSAFSGDSFYDGCLRYVPFVQSLATSAALLKHLAKCGPKMGHFQDSSHNTPPTQMKIFDVM
jgi:hypothetical protein